jgi:hypothetical protein
VTHFNLQILDWGFGRPGLTNRQRTRSRPDAQQPPEPDDAPAKKKVHVVEEHALPAAWVAAALA